MKLFDLWLFFSSQREMHFVSNMNFHYKLSYSLSKFLLSWLELWNCSPNILMENCNQTNWSYFCMPHSVVPSAKFTILILWSTICIPLILVLTSMKIASTSAAIMHDNIKSEQSCWNFRMIVKDLDRRPFILILDWILMEATWIM